MVKFIKWVIKRIRCKHENKEVIHLHGATDKKYHGLIYKCNDCGTVRSLII